MLEGGSLRGGGRAGAASGTGLSRIPLAQGEGLRSGRAWGKQGREVAGWVPGALPAATADPRAPRVLLPALPRAQPQLCACRSPAALPVPRALSWASTGSVTPNASRSVCQCGQARWGLLWCWLNPPSLQPPHLLGTPDTCVCVGAARCLPAAEVHTPSPCPPSPTLRAPPRHPVPPVTPRTAIHLASAPLYYKNRHGGHASLRGGAGASGQVGPAPGRPPPARSGATRPATASRAPRAAPSAGPAAASPRRRCPTAISCKGTAVRARHRGQSTAPGVRRWAGGRGQGARLVLGCGGTWLAELPLTPAPW